MAQGSKQSTYLKDLVTSGVSVSIANIATLPMDVLKVRLQLQTIQLANDFQGPRPGLVTTGLNIFRYEGVSGFWKGLSPAVARGLFYGGVRLGSYQPLKAALGGTKENSNIFRNVAAGSLSGGMAALASNPIDLMKTRMQAKDNPHRSSMAVIRHVVATDGVQGLWRGAVPAVARAAVLTASQCATYDEAKQAWMRLTGGGDTMSTHVGASMISGLVTTTLTAPLDVVKTNMFNGGSKYTGWVHCASDMMKREGPLSLLKGWSPNYLRLGPQTTIILVMAEQLRKLNGLESL